MWRLPTSLSAALLTLCLPAAAQLDPLENEEQEDVRWYQIEVLFFHNLASANQREEKWPIERHLTVVENAITFPRFDEEGNYIEPVDEDALEETTEEIIEKPAPIAADETTLDEAVELAEPLPPYIFVPQEEQQLADARQRLERHNDYAIIESLAWRQELVKGDEPIFFQVTSGDQYGESWELEGHIGFYLRRYLHTFADLWLTEFVHLPSNVQPEGNWFGSDMGNMATTSNNSLYGDKQEFSLDFGSLFTDQYSIVQTAGLKEKRRMRSNETHYLDHPLFGLMVRITPWEPPGEDEEELESFSPETPAISAR